MKAISIKQPFANFILFGWKTLETRTWQVNYRGPLVIVASREIHPGVCILNGKYYDCLDIVKMFWRQEIPLHLGKAICEVQLKGVRDMTTEDQPAACCPIYEGAKAWELTDVSRLIPFEVRGQMGLYEIGEELLAYEHKIPSYQIPTILNLDSIMQELINPITT